ncbi:MULTISPECIES: hypothetical protein [unclassified Enterococcus]|nr:MULTISPECIES: hypothetical protein [unclassified Enterococcus]
MKKGLASFCHYKKPRQAVVRLQLLCYLVAIALILSLVFNFVLLTR